MKKTMAILSILLNLLLLIIGVFLFAEDFIAGTILLSLSGSSIAVAADYLRILQRYPEHTHSLQQSEQITFQSAEDHHLAESIRDTSVADDLSPEDMKKLLDGQGNDLGSLLKK